MPTNIDMNWFWEGTLEAIAVVFKYMWWLLPLALFQPMCEWALRSWQRSKDAKAGLPDIDRMSGERFEEWLATFFRSRGYGVRLTPRTADCGVDLVLNKGGRTTAVQAKCWKGNVGSKAIQEVYTGKAHYRTDAALVVTNSRYTSQAWKLAKSTGVSLWDRDTLRTEILKDREQVTAGSTPRSVDNSSLRRR